MRRRVPHFVLLVLNAIVAATAIGGGIVLATGMNPFPAEWLAGTPFVDYRLPGLLLALVVGGSAAVAATLLAASTTAEGAVASVVAGIVIMGWIAGEVLLLAQPAAPTRTEIFYFLLGLTLVIVAMIYRRQLAAPPVA